MEVFRKIQVEMVCITIGRQREPMWNINLNEMVYTNGVERIIYEINKKFLKVVIF